MDLSCEAVSEWYYSTVLAHDFSEEKVEEELGKEEGVTDATASGTGKLDAAQRQGRVVREPLSFGPRKKIDPALSSDYEEDPAMHCAGLIEETIQPIQPIQLVERIGHGDTTTVQCNPLVAGCREHEGAI